MDKHVASLLPDTDILDAVAFLVEKRVTGAPVVDRSGKLIGILTETDCLRLIAEGIDGRLPRGSVAAYMTPDPESISPEMDIYYAAGLFIDRDFRRFLVVEDGKLVGAITRFDILRAVSANLALAGARAPAGTK
jgi:CBS domain-containing protein